MHILQKNQMFHDPHAFIDIPLCRMIGMQVVQPALSIDIKKLKADFIHGYRVGAAVFYVLITNFQGLERLVTDSDREGWDANWIRKDKEFE